MLFHKEYSFKLFFWFEMNQFGFPTFNKWPWKNHTKQSIHSTLLFSVWWCYFYHNNSPWISWHFGKHVLHLSVLQVRMISSLRYSWDYYVHYKENKLIKLQQIFFISSYIQNSLLIMDINLTEVVCLSYPYPVHKHFIIYFILHENKL